MKVLAVSYDAQPAAIQPFMEKNGYNFKVALDDREKGITGRLLQVGGIPTLFLIDADGVIRLKKVGFAPGDEKEIQAKVKSLFAGA